MLSRGGGCEDVRLEMSHGYSTNQQTTTTKQNGQPSLSLLAATALCLMGANTPLTRAFAAPPVGLGKEQKSSEPIPWSEIGARAGAKYQSDGLSILSSEDGAVIRCAFQKLEGEATAEGLWLTSTVARAADDRFRVVASAAGRSGGRLDGSCAGAALARLGTVTVEPEVVRFIRPGLVEEYSVSLDGVRQDFIIAQRPAGAGELRVELDVQGAQTEAAAHGARLVLKGSGRKIAYSQLRVEDAEGRALHARLEVDSAACLAVVVDDAAAVYPVRIDPTFSDANWISMGGMPGADGTVAAAVTDASGNLYVGGSFTVIGEVVANHVAKWNGSAWTALGSGLSGPFGTAARALLVSGGELFVGGNFTNAGGNAANGIAKWDGNAWTAISSGVNGAVYALAMSGNDLYVGGIFSTAGGNAASRIAKWDGNAWTALGSGLGGGGGGVGALAVSGSNLYAGGDFTVAGGSPANYVAEWDGSAWSALGLGVFSQVNALAVSGSDLYVGGFLSRAGSDLYVGGSFTAAGGNPANCIAKWDGTAWTPLGSGLNEPVRALVVSGNDLYVGGAFTTAGVTAANRIAKWNGSGWTALGSGLNISVYATAVWGNALYLGGGFTTADGSAANHIAKWDGSGWTTLGSALNDYVYALAVSGSNLYVGGSFTVAGGSPANYVAQWDGSAWTALGSGLNRAVGALA